MAGCNQAEKSVRRAATNEDGVTGTLTAPSGVGGVTAGKIGAKAPRRVAGAGPVESGATGSDRPVPAADTPLSKEDVVARLFEAFNRGDLASTLTLLHPEIVFQPMTAEVTQAGEPYRGHEGMRRYTEDIAAHWDELIVHPAQRRGAGRAVVVLGLVSGSGPAGSFKNAPTTWVVKFKEGLVVHAQIFSDARYVVEALVGEEA
jgi:ketosteroid isomerase-like protein